ncbi:MAG: ATP-binding protein [Acidobacteriota bacterium]
MDACQMSEKDKNRIDIRTFEKNGILGFEVADDGCGMDYEVKRRIFTTFFTTKGAGGTGIGLLTVQKIAQEHGGDIELESDPGKGTTFRILLSRERLAQLAAESAESGDGAEGDSSKGGNAGGAHGETR